MADQAARISDGGPTGAPTELYGEWYYGPGYGIPYEDNEHWREFFGRVADRIVATINPKTVLDAGCAKGFLVRALRERGVDAVGVDFSEHAIAAAPAEVREHVRVHDLTRPLDGRYELVTCIEVIEHLTAVDGPLAVKHLAEAGERVLLSSTPDGYDEPTHLTVRPVEHWSLLFAEQNMFRADHDASYLTPWAVLYEHRPATLPEVVRDTERLIGRLQREVVSLRTVVLDQQREIERLASEWNTTSPRMAEQYDLAEEVLHLRDLLAGAEAEVGAAQGEALRLGAWIHRYEAAIAYHEEVLASRSWRLSQLALKPMIRLRQRRDR